MRAEPTIRLTDLFRPTEIVILKHVVEHGNSKIDALLKAVNELVADTAMVMSLSRAEEFADLLCMHGWLHRTSIDRYYCATEQTLNIGHVLRAVQPVHVAAKPKLVLTEQAIPKPIWR